VAAASEITCNGAGPPDEEAPATSGEEPGCGDLGCPCLSVDRCDVGLCLEGVCSCEYPVNNCPCVDGACFIAEYECVDDICTFDDTPTCGDGYCALGESCPADCMSPYHYYCGDGACDPGEICPRDCGGPVCGDGTCEPGESCAGDCMPACSQQSLGMAPLGPPPFFCGAAGPATLALMDDINTFWGSALVPCVCGPDVPAPFGPFCQGNAFAANAMNYLFGYIYYDPNKLAELQAIAGGSLLAPVWFLAHEAGHNVQATRGLASSYPIFMELSADCLAGYFVGWLACLGEINEFDVQGALMSVCSTQDSIGTPWFDPSAHGSCQNRMDATVWGMNAYFTGTPPAQACSP